MPTSIQTLVPTDERSPAVLGISGFAGADLSYTGNLAILDTSLVGLLCSQRCSGSLIIKTFDLAVAMRDSGIPVIGGFHSLMEQECLRLLLRGDQPVVHCPARSIARMRIPTDWRTPIQQGRLLVISPFEPQHNRPTRQLAEQRNRFVVALASTLLIAHASAGGSIMSLAGEALSQGKRVLTLADPDNDDLVSIGAIPIEIEDVLNIEV